MLWRKGFSPSSLLHFIPTRCGGGGYGWGLVSFREVGCTVRLSGAALTLKARVEIAIWKFSWIWVGSWIDKSKDRWPCYSCGQGHFLPTEACAPACNPSPIRRSWLLLFMPWTCLGSSCMWGCPSRLHRNCNLFRMPQLICWQLRLNFIMQFLFCRSSTGYWWFCRPNSRSWLSFIKSYTVWDPCSTRPCLNFGIRRRHLCVPPLMEAQLVGTRESAIHNYSPALEIHPLESCVTFQMDF